MDRTRLGSNFNSMPANQPQPPTGSRSDAQTRMRSLATQLCHPREPAPLRLPHPDGYTAALAIRMNRLSSCSPDVRSIPPALADFPTGLRGTTSRTRASARHWAPRAPTGTDDMPNNKWSWCGKGHGTIGPATGMNGNKCGCPTRLAGMRKPTMA